MILAMVLAVNEYMETVKHQYYAHHVSHWIFDNRVSYPIIRY